MDSQERNHSITSLAEIWAKKYINNLVDVEQEWSTALIADKKLVGRKLMELLRPTSSKAWAKTEALLGQELARHQIDPNLIIPWEISHDVYHIYQETLQLYVQEEKPYTLAVALGQQIGDMRRKYTQVDARIMGFISMHFHYMGEALLEVLCSPEKEELGSYFKVLDDYLYMPLQRAYNAAAQYDYHDPILGAVRQLLPHIDKIAHSITQQTIRAYPKEESLSGALNHPRLLVSSRRDVEMFQIYLCVCVLEQNIFILQEELFPLCVMLYPPLKVKWQLVRYFISSLQNELSKYLTGSQLKVFQPYVHSLEVIFSSRVLSQRKFA